MASTLKRPSAKKTSAAKATATAAKKRTASRSKTVSKKNKRLPVMTSKRSTKCCRWRQKLSV